MLFDFCLNRLCFVCSVQIRSGFEASMEMVRAQLYHSRHVQSQMHDEIRRLRAQLQALGQPVPAVTYELPHTDTILRTPATAAAALADDATVVDASSSIDQCRDVTMSSSSERQQQQQQQKRDDSVACDELQHSDDVDSTLRQQSPTMTNAVSSHDATTTTTTTNTNGHQSSAAAPSVNGYHSDVDDDDMTGNDVVTAAATTADAAFSGADKTEIPQENNVTTDHSVCQAKSPVTS